MGKVFNLLIPRFFFAKSQVQIVKKSGKHEIEIRIVNRHERSQKIAKKDYSKSPPQHFAFLTQF